MAKPIDRLIQFKYDYVGGVPSSNNHCNVTKTSTTFSSPRTQAQEPRWLRNPDGNSEEFDILSVVLQGDTLAPFLFVRVLYHALRKAISGREQELGLTLKHQGGPDDTLQ